MNVKEIAMLILSILSLTWCAVYFIKYAMSDLKELLFESDEEV